MMNKKAQMNPANFIVLFFTFIIALAMMPVINNISDSTVAGLQAAPNEGTDLVITVIRMIPFMIIVGTILTALYWAVPSREGMP